MRAIWLVFFIKRWSREFFHGSRRLILINGYCTSAGDDDMALAILIIKQDIVVVVDLYVELSFVLLNDRVIDPLTAYGTRHFIGTFAPLVLVCPSATSSISIKHHTADEQNADHDEDEKNLYFRKKILKKY